MPNRATDVKLQLAETVTSESVSRLRSEQLLQDLMYVHVLATRLDTSQEDKAVLREQVRILKREAERRMNG
jgi:hypothetical protein